MHSQYAFLNGRTRRLNDAIVKAWDLYAVTKRSTSLSPELQEQLLEKLWLRIQRMTAQLQDLETQSKT